VTRARGPPARVLGACGMLASVLQGRKDLRHAAGGTRRERCPKAAWDSVWKTTACRVSGCGYGPPLLPISANHEQLYAGRRNGRSVWHRAVLYGPSPARTTRGGMSCLARAPATPAFGLHQVNTSQLWRKPAAGPRSLALAAPATTAAGPASSARRRARGAASATRRLALLRVPLLQPLLHEGRARRAAHRAAQRGPLGSGLAGLSGLGPRPLSPRLRRVARAPLSRGPGSSGAAQPELAGLLGILGPRNGTHPCDALGAQDRHGLSWTRSGSTRHVRFELATSAPPRAHNADSDASLEAATRCPQVYPPAAGREGIAHTPRTSRVLTLTASLRFVSTCGSRRKAWPLRHAARTRPHQAH
jgi:hypothetical protein